MTALASVAQDKNVKQTLQGCGEEFSEAKNDLTKATTLLEDKDYDGTNSLVNEALQQEVACQKNVLNYKVSIPFNIIYDMRVYEELSDAAMRMIVFFFIRSPFVSADETLIQLQCHNAEVPSTCIQCVKSDPRGQSTDKVAIAGIVISCLSNHARSLSGNMTALASTMLDKDVKRALQTCGKRFSEAKTDLAKATNMLKNKDYDETNSPINKALQKEVDCQKNVWDYRAFVPDSVIYDMRVYQELSDAAMRIVDRF
ncbi:hypothetical protein V6N13_087846 [Hibiscus sabdariffa]|uniref:Pectinesterase inhibitor domain-containing protein n=1 Tax=Hibiscus sabdariffa TaxID=183260 RepID=A0ABR2FXY5_9ROSI